MIRRAGEKGKSAASRESLNRTRTRRPLPRRDFGGILLRMKDYAALLAKPYTDAMVERFLRYAEMDTQSDRHIEEIPSTKTQWNLARLLEREL